MRIWRRVWQDPATGTFLKPRGYEFAAVDVGYLHWVWCLPVPFGRLFRVYRAMKQRAIARCYDFLHDHFRWDTP